MQAKQVKDDQFKTGIDWRRQFTTVTWFSKLLALILFFVFLVMSFYLGTRYSRVLYLPAVSLTGSDQKDIPNENKFDSDVRSVVSERLTCRENSNYLVVAKATSEDLSSDILVKYKDIEGQTLPCNYIAKESDYEMIGLEATYLMALADNFLVLDIGTGPDIRKLAVIDLRLRKEVYSDSYVSVFPDGGVSIKENVLVYWTPTDEEANQSQCPQMQEWRSGGLGARIDKQVTLDMNTLTVEDTGERRCDPKQ
jgi:hypothetical protein